jgi:hypothetical protein
MRWPIAVAFCLLSAAVYGQVTPAAGPRTALTGPAHITGAQAGRAIAVVVIPNPAIASSDEIAGDPRLKWDSWIPVKVWRLRKIEGDYRLCAIATFQFEYAPGGELHEQLFVIPAGVTREFDAILFEGRPWYSIAVSVTPPGEFVVLPSDPGRVAPSGSGEVLNCSDDPRITTTHAAMFKE